MHKINMIEFNPKEEAALNKLLADLHIEDIKELFNLSISMVIWAVAEKKKGNEIASINKKEMIFQELTTPLLDNIIKEN